LCLPDRTRREALTGWDDSLEEQKDEVEGQVREQLGDGTDSEQTEGDSGEGSDGLADKAQGSFDQASDKARETSVRADPQSHDSST
jgi:uncharacterized protein YjbJ (UPF0337 family)